MARRVEPSTRLPNNILYAWCGLTIFLFLVSVLSLYVISTCTSYSSNSPSISYPSNSTSSSYPSNSTSSSYPSNSTSSSYPSNSTSSSYPSNSPVNHNSTDHLEPMLPNHLEFLSKKRVLLVSHELSPSGEPLLLMELAFLMREVGAKVVWITCNNSLGLDEETHNLEFKLRARQVKVVSARGQEARDTASTADLVIISTVMGGNWFDYLSSDHLAQVLPKVVWWIHEMPEQITKKYVKHLPFVGAVMLDTNASAKYWKNKTRELGIKLPTTHVVLLGVSKETMELAENSIGKKVLRHQTRRVIGVPEDDVVVASIDCGSGSTHLFLEAFALVVHNMEDNKYKLPPLHAIIIGITKTSQKSLKNFLQEKKIRDRVSFANKKLALTSYLAASDVLALNCQADGECFGRTIIEAMAFRLPVLGTGLGGMIEMVVDKETGFLHSVGSEGVYDLANKIKDLGISFGLRFKLGNKGYRRVKDQFLEQKMIQKISVVLKEVLGNVES